MEGLWREGLRNKCNPDVSLAVTHPGIWKQDSHFFLKCCGKSTTLLSLGACCLLMYLSTASSTSQPVSLSPVGGKEGEVYVGFPNRQCKQTKLWVNMFLTKEINCSIHTQRIGKGWAWNGIPDVWVQCTQLWPQLMPVASAKAVRVTHLRLFWSTTFGATNPAWFPWHKFKLVSSLITRHQNSFNFRTKVDVGTTYFLHCLPFLAFHSRGLQSGLSHLLLIFGVCWSCCGQDSFPYDLLSSVERWTSVEVILGIRRGSSCHAGGLLPWAECLCHPNMHVWKS